MVSAVNTMHLPAKTIRGYYAKVASEHLPLALDVISDMLLTPKLLSEDIEREKGVIVEEMNMYEDDPRRKIDSVYDEVIYGQSHLGRDIIGYKETVRSFHDTDFRDFLDSWYHLRNVVLVIAGDAERIKKLNLKDQNIITQAFAKGTVRTGKGSMKFVVPKQTKPQIKVVYKKTEQAHFYLGFPGLKRDHEDRFGQMVLTNFLGGNSSARLFNEIREKRGLAYYAYASSESYADVGSIYAFEGVDPSRVEEALAVTVEEFKKAASGDVTQAEVDRTKEYLRGKLILDFEDSQSVAVSYARRALLSAKMESLDALLENIAKVDLPQVKRLANTQFDFSKVNLALIGPYKGTRRFLSLLA
jgi:predicted Zn-dependent peptidase